MGICESATNKKQSKKDNLKSKDLEDRQTLNRKDFRSKSAANNEISEIRNEKKTSIKRNINDESLSDCLDIIDCVDSTIIIFHPLSKVNISKCFNCSIFIAPCKGSIYLDNCKDLNLICASQQFRGRSLENCKISLFCSTTPSIESVKNLEITCYCFNYVHLKELFDRSEMTIWNNNWGKIYNFSGKENSKEIRFFDLEADENFFENFKLNLKDSDTEIKSYNPVPFTWGLSRLLSRNEKHILIFLDNGSIEFKELNEFIDRKNLDPIGYFLINTRALSVSKAKSLLEKNFESHIFSEIDKIEIKKENQMREEEVIVLWICNDNDDFSFINNLIEDEDNSIKPFFCITNDLFPNFPSVVKDIFGHEFAF